MPVLPLHPQQQSNRLPTITPELPLHSAQVLMLAGHSFNGTLPPSWTRLQKLRVLDLSHNSLSGNLPSWYVSMRKLAVLKVQDNRLVPSGSSS